MSDGRSEQWVDGFNHAMRVMALWLDFQSALPLDRRVLAPGFSTTGMRKSNLLGRLMRGEEIRRRPCPQHLGQMAPVPPDGLPCGCGGTGWLPNPPDATPATAQPWWRFW